ncbi:ribonuclease P NDAI_0K00220 [Naumovozyma dairenensis CBS 421]|uniref:Uncharacterized protein n=1 Tax=Naumovozyma dairenensis (strain ATCC 10597 / BCRC 20456 / CBS 421 / NBRC 0211 / NRRL Y-12639) TaxID=1071378 RepID=G0WHF0_NAUDC|nr:hypothetical protein NDAI_0K00220 [Naumovozyma dairenensis CBS 421]CCD27211.1 hypothetical protein NDAI_0K00220 [Naumovozyma dairenensis CBS 421]
MAFKSIKYKLGSKGYHRHATTFFDSSYNHLRQNQAVFNIDPSIPNSNGITTLQPHPVVVANTNYNNLDDVLYRDPNFHIQKKKSTSTTTKIVPNTSNNNQNNSSRNFYILKNTNNNNNTTNNNNNNNNRRKSIAIINGAANTLNKRFYSTTTTTTTTTLFNTQKISNSNELQLQSQSQSQSQSQTSVASDTTTNTTHIPSSSPWEIDTETSLNPKTYLSTHINEINKAYLMQDFNKINSLYHSLKRNNIIPPIETFEKILDSISKRLMDKFDLDNKMFEMLSCYQDIINNKLKPSNAIYNILLSSLFKNSIMAIHLQNSNGQDFFKIAIELFKTINQQQQQQQHHHTHTNIQLSKDTINYTLIAINLYPGFIDINHLISYINNSPFLIKNSLYFISLLNYSTLINNNTKLKELFNEYTLYSQQGTNNNTTLKEDKFKIISIYISGLVETSNIDLATSLLDQTLNEIKQTNGLNSNISLLLSKYLISMSKINPESSYEMWIKFNKLNWIPEFSYDFYLQLMNNSFHNWTLTKKIYNYIFPMKRSFHNNHKSLNSINISENAYECILFPMDSYKVIDSLLDYSLQLNDTEIILKLCQESLIKSFNFNINLYPLLFEFLKNNLNWPQDYLLDFITTHTSLLLVSSESESSTSSSSSSSSSSSDNFLNFLNAIINNYHDKDLLLKISQSTAFKNGLNQLSFQLSPSLLSNNIQLESKFNGLFKIFKNIWQCPKTFESYPNLLELYSIIIIKFFDFNLYPLSPVIQQQQQQQPLLNFIKETITNYKTLLINYQRANPYANVQLSSIVKESITLIATHEEIPEEVITFYLNSEENIDSQTPSIINLGPSLRNSFKTAIKDFNTLLKKGYSFDFDTYKTLIMHRYINKTIISTALELSPSELETKQIINLIIKNCPIDNLENEVINHPLFYSKILPLVNDRSLKRLTTTTNIWETLPDFLNFIKSIDFPNNFKNIQNQITFKETIEAIYNRLFNQFKDYQTIVKFNKICPNLNSEQLLLSLIRSGEYEKYETLSYKYSKDPLLKEETFPLIQAEFLINTGKFDNALENLNNMIDQLPNDTDNNIPERLIDLYTFASFLKSLYMTDSDDITINPKLNSKINNTLQAANLFSMQNNFSNMIELHEQLFPYSSQLTMETTTSKPTSTNSAVLEQMLNNLYDSLSLVDIETSSVLKQYKRKLKNYLRFKYYIKLPTFQLDEVKTLITIWNEINTHEIDCLFNNIIETMYLNPRAQQLFFENDMVLNFNKLQFNELISHIENAYESKNNNDNLVKVHKLKEFLQI